MGGKIQCRFCHCELDDIEKLIPHMQGHHWRQYHEIRRWANNKVIPRMMHLVDYGQKGRPMEFV